MPRPLPEPVLFLDECLGTVEVPRALRAANIRVEVLLDHLEPQTADEVWLSHAADRGWVVVTKDKWIRRRAVERSAILNSRVPAFILTSGDMNGAEIGAALVKAYPRMQKLLRDFVPPFIAAVSSEGSVSLLTTPGRRGARRRGDETGV